MKHAKKHRSFQQIDALGADVSVVTARSGDVCAAPPASRIARGMRWCVLAVVAMEAACALRPPGDPGTEELSVPVLIEDVIADGMPAAAWATSTGPDLAVCALNSSVPGETWLSVYELPPYDGNDDGVVRLDLFFGAPADLFAALEDNDVEANARIARSRSSVWQINSIDNIAALPFVVDGLEEALEFDVAQAFVFDSSDPAARRCGDEAAATCSTGCDVVTGRGDAPCCAEASAAFLACNAVVFTVETTNQVARLRRGL